LIEQMFDQMERVVGVIPPGLDQMEPGPVLAAFLTSVEGEDLSGYDRVVVLRTYQRLASHVQAQVYKQMAAISDLMNEMDDDPELASESAAAEIRVALRLTRRAADTELDLAVDLKQRLPRVWVALSAGEIDPQRAKVIVYGTAHLTEETARLVVDEIIGRASQMTTGQLNSVLRRLCVRADPEEAANRYQDAVDGRRINTEASVEGTANLLGLDLPPDRVAGVMKRIAEMAQSLKRSDEIRTVDQLRADIFLDLLEGRSHRGRTGRGVVDIQVNLETLTRLSEDPGELAGYGPVIADIARQITESQTNSEWRFTITHPETGQIIHNGLTRRRPTSGMRRHVEARNPTCIFPGCRMPATDCDLDHRIPWAHRGRTSTDNFAPLCRHDHIVKHRCGWKHRPLPNGDHQWTSRLGHIYTTSGRSP
jgi:hypothetical protein